MGDLNVVGVARAVKLRLTGRDWWWRGLGCWQYSASQLAVEWWWWWRGGGVVVAVAHKLKVCCFSAYLLFFLAIASK